MKKLIFSAAALTPLVAIVAGTFYLLLLTNLPQVLYEGSIRNIYFNCFDFVSAPYVYKMKPGPCPLKNIEFDVSFSHDADGFRNPLATASDIVAIGDSQTHGFGVRDDQTFSALLGTRYGHPTRNLGIASYATMRELEVLREFGADAKYVILQYCDNDAGENDASLRLSKEEFTRRVQTAWRANIDNYNRGKAEGFKKPLRDFASLITSGAYRSKSTWRESASARNIDREVSDIARIFALYRATLQDKRLIIFEASPWGLNSARFAPLLRAELGKHGWLSFRIVDAGKLLSSADYYFLDGHVNPAGHRKLASAIDAELNDWERSEPSRSLPLRNSKKYRVIRSLLDRRMLRLSRHRYG